MCYIWHIVNSTTFERPRIKVNGMENFLLSHHWVSLDVSHVLACKRKAECVCLRITFPLGISKGNTTNTNEKETE